MKVICKTSYRGKLENGQEYEVEEQREQEFFVGKRTKTATIYKFFKILGCRYLEGNFNIV